MRLTILFLFPILFFSQNHYKNFREAFKSNDVASQKKILKKWKRSSPDNAEMMMSQLSYYFNIARKESFLIKENDKSNSYASTTNNGASGGFVSSGIATTESTIDFELIKEGLDWIDRAIAIHNDRIDVRLAKADAYAEIADWKNFGETVVEIVRQSYRNANEWQNEGDRTITDSESYFFLTIQDCQLKLFEQQLDVAYTEMIRIGVTMLQFYPDHIESMSNIAIGYMNRDNYPMALKYLLEAEVIAPEDSVILVNIANCYLASANKSKAITYYKKALPFSESYRKEFVKNKLKELNANSKKIYHVIGASFKSKLNAEKHHKKMLKRGFKSRLLPINSSKLYPVSYGTFASEDEANEFLININNKEDISGFILSK